MSLSPREIYTGLGPDFWKQYIDGIFHRYGPKVFDQGLHRGTKEPGYLQGIQRAAEYALRFLEVPVNLFFYKTLHREACSHFDGRATLVAAEYAGTFFINKEVTKAFSSAFDLWPNQREEQTAELQKLAAQSKMGPNPEEATKKLVQRRLAIVEEFKRRNEYIAKISKQIGASKPIAQISLHDSTELQIIYTRDPLELDRIVTTLFAQFQEKIELSKTDDERLITIADLYQKLEWLHPFPDGQGRTDILLLNKLLVQYGFTPAILKRPYVSTLSSLGDWVEYLKEGMKCWEQERKTPSRPTERPIESPPTENSDIEEE